MVRDSLEVARSLGIKIERAKICSGSKEPLCGKIIANVMNLKVDVLEVEEKGPSMGGSCWQAVGCERMPG